MTLTKFRKNAPVLNPFFDNFFDSEFFDTRSGGSAPLANIKEREDQFEVELAVPGFDKNDIQIDLNDGLLTISSEKTSENEDKDTHYSRREFQYASFTRSFRLPDNVNEDDIQAKFNNGVLEVHIPKAKELKKSKSIEIS